MSEDKFHAIRLILNFDDGATFSETIRLANSDGNSSDRIQDLPVTVAGMSDGSDALQHAEHATFLAADWLLSTSTGTELEDAIRSALHGMLPERLAGSPAQQKKFEQFLQDALRPQATDALRTYCRLVESVLPDGSLGNAWGCTVMPSSTCLARVNVGRWETLALRRDGKCRVHMQGPASDLSDSGVDAFAGIETGAGFEKLEPNFTVEVSFGGLADLLNNLTTRSAIERQIARCHQDRQKLMQPNWHSPLAETLLSS